MIVNNKIFYLNNRLANVMTNSTLVLTSFIAFAMITLAATTIVRQQTYAQAIMSRWE